MKKIIESYGEEYHKYTFDSFKINRCFIIETNKPIGFVYFSMTKNLINIWEFQIIKNEQGKGFGKKLMEHMINFAREKNLKKVILEAHDSNKQAIYFYDKFGFKKNKSKKNKIFFEYKI